jgi:hypothetical protein
VVLVEPVEIVRGEVDAGGNTLLPERLHDLAKNIPLERRMHDAEIGGFGVPHGEAGVVFGSENHAADACELCQRGPVFGMKLARIEGFGQFGEETARVIV